MSAVLLVLALLQPPTPERQAGALARVQRGMAPEEVRRILGSPPRIARQLLFGKYLEQWIYPPPISARIEFLCERNLPPAVRTIRATNP